MRPSKPFLSPTILRGKTWTIEWYFEVAGDRKRIRKSSFDGVDLNAIADLEAREVAAQRALADLKARLCPAAIAPEHESFLSALAIAIELKRSAKNSTNKSFTEVARWVGEFFTAKGWQHLRCNQVTQAHIQAYFDHCVVKLKVANSTHNTRKNNLRSLFSELVTRGYFPFNYVSKVPERPAGDPLRRPLSPEEKAIVARHIFQNDKALALAFLLLGYLAVRPGEIRDLRVGAIDLKRGVVRFPGADSKNNRDSVVTIPSELITHFERLKLDQYPQSYYLFGRAKGRYNVQLEPRPERIGVNTLSARFRTIVRTLHQQGQLHNIKGIQFYSLKDSLAIYLLDMGVDVESAMRHFRHRDLSVFQRYVKRLGVVNEKIRGLEIDLEFWE